ncbi:GtrA-like protein [compost metagenome]
MRHKGVVKFLFVGSLNTIVDLILFFIFANIFNIYAPVASIISTGLTLIMSFFLNHHFVFRSNKRRRTVAVQFVIITLVNVWLVQSSIIGFVVHSYEHTVMFADHIWTLNLVAKLCGVSVSLVLNFLGYKYIFKDSNDSK